MAITAAVGGSSAEPAEAGVIAQAVAEVVPIALGDTVAGRLSDGDTVLTTGEFADVYSFDAVSGQQVRVTMRSQEFDTYLGVLGPEGYSVANDDSPGMGTNSQLILTLPHSGEYRIQATSYAAGSRGRYTLLFEPLLGGALPATGSASIADVVPIADGVDVVGALDADDPTLRTGEHFDTYVYRGRAGERLSITLRSDDFDSYLMLRGPEGLSRDNDDVEEGSLNAGIGVTLPADGDYRIVATSFAAGERGAYTLRVDSAGVAVAAVGGQLQPGVPATSELGIADTTRAGGQHYHQWRFEGRAGQTATIDLASDRFDTFLILRTPGGQEHVNDDISNRDTNSRLNLVLPDDGVYEIHASSYLPEVVGPYTLSLTVGDVAGVVESVVDDEGSGEAVALAFGDAVSGRLTRRDAQLRTGEYYDTYTIDGRAGQGLTLTMESSNFDTYLLVRGPNGYSRDNDDGPGMGTNSRIEAVLPEDGVYTVLATSYAPGESGRYTLSLVEGTTVQQNARGRIFAVLAGISEYPDASDLAYCADDAVKLGETLADTGLLAPESIVITDAQVTRENLERAFRTVAAAVGPEDVFMFFYSGHGSHVPSRSELNGRDETLYLVDGHVTDDEVARWFDRVNARLSIIALDSCFSGGFARDVISAPNRMGIFSSEEDVTSNVASRFQAGGYLSYFLRNGISGAADVDPADGIITVGELAQYLRRQWAEHNMNYEVTETADAAGAYQNLVIDRGSVKVTDVVVYRGEASPADGPTRQQPAKGHAVVSP